MPSSISLENKLQTNKHILLNCLPGASLSSAQAVEQQTVLTTFLGLVFTLPADLASLQDIEKQPGRVIYVLGNAALLDQPEYESTLQTSKEVRVIASYTSSTFTRLPFGASYHSIRIGQVPLNYHNVGVYYKDFHSENDISDQAEEGNRYFAAIRAYHRFQGLTESNKPGVSYRKGLYLSDVTEDDSNGQDLHFHLLRCSTNLDGPTENLATVDRQILVSINEAASEHYQEQVNLNHVLAQIYENSSVANIHGRMKEKKARIKRHSDKTKDMPRNGLITFNTFYATNLQKHTKSSETDVHDLCTKGASVLTHLKFCLKDDVDELDRSAGLVSTFSAPLYPNSLLLISLKTNRLYTHEIEPSHQNVADLPTRLGYVVRCSATRAVHRRGVTYFTTSATEEEKALQKADEAGLLALKDLYFRENTTTETMDYSGIQFSPNEGDYCRPIL